MELIEFGRLSEAQSADLVGVEDDPWDAADIGLEWRPKDRHVGLRDHDGRLVATAGLLIDDVQFGEQAPIAVVGIGGVIVAARYRGKGLGGRVISEILSLAERLGPDIALLFCRPDRADLYRRYGFAEVPAEVLVEQPNGVVQMPSVTMWRPLEPGARLPQGTVRVHGLPF